MTLQAAGAYLQRLREEADITRHALAKRVNTSDSQIIRIEQGQETRFSLLGRIIRVVNANAEDVIDLMMKSDNTTDDGIRCAELWINNRNKTENRTEVHPDVLGLLSRMSEYEIGKWVASGERMLEDRTKAR